MEIVFKDPDLHQMIENQSDSKLVRRYGPNVAKMVNQRIAEILACYHLAMLKEVHPGLHPLKHKRRGQFAVDLGPAFRLVFEPATITTSKRPDGTFIWERVDRIRILEIIDYHDE